MPTDFPLWRMRPEEAARIIILEPLRPVERHKFWRKRTMNIKPSSKDLLPDEKRGQVLNRFKGAQYKPRRDDLKFLSSAERDRWWSAKFEEWNEAFPVIAVLVGPMLRNGQFYSQPQTARPANPLPTERERTPWAGPYSREAYEADCEYFEAARALLRENYILGQRDEGPYMDGLVYLRVDSLLLAEMAHCKARLQATWALIEANRLAKQMARPKVKTERVWQNIGNDEAVAMKYKQSGYQVRKIDTLTNRHWEVSSK